MKQFFLLFVTMLFVAITFAQQLPQSEQLTKEYYLLAYKNNFSRTGNNILTNIQFQNNDSLRNYYLKKARRQKITGLIMTPVGGALGMFSLLGVGFSNFTGQGEKGENTKYKVGLVAGVAMVAGGIVLLKSSGSNKRKANELATSINLKAESYDGISQYSSDFKNYPSVGLQIKF